MKKERFYTLREAAKILRVSERSMYRYLEEGKLKAAKIGYWRITNADIQDFMRRFSNQNKKRK